LFHSFLKSGVAAILISAKGGSSRFGMDKTKADRSLDRCYNGCNNTLFGGYMGMKLKLIAVGNSTGVILPKELLEKLRLEKGDELQVLEGPDGIRLTQYTEKFDQQLDVAEAVMRRRRNLLKKLAE
jgi:putative addiction module antidote